MHTDTACKTRSHWPGSYPPMRDSIQNVTRQLFCESEQESPTSFFEHRERKLIV